MCIDRLCLAVYFKPLAGKECIMRLVQSSSVTGRWCASILHSELVVELGGFSYRMPET